MSLRVEEIGKTFGELKQIGIVGQDLSNQIVQIHTITKNVTETFELKLADHTEWSNNFYTFAGEDGMEYAQNVYTILKEMQTKLEELG